MKGAETSLTLVRSPRAVMTKAGVRSVRSVRSEASVLVTREGEAGDAPRTRGDVLVAV